MSVLFVLLFCVSLWLITMACFATMQNTVGPDANYTVPFTNSSHEETASIVQLVVSRLLLLLWCNKKLQTLYYIII